MRMGRTRGEFADPRRPLERPTERATDHDGVVREHPAFGCVEVVRQTGGRDAMFRSGLAVSTSIMVRVYEAEEVRRLQSSTHYARSPIVQFSMTELQWAQFVSAIGSGGGVPCTLEYRQTGDMVQVPAIEDRTAAEDRAQHIAETAERQLAHLREAMAIVDRLAAPGTKVSKADLAEVQSKLRSGVTHAPSNFKFAANMVTEHLNEVVHEAKAELRGAHAALGLPDTSMPRIERLAPRMLGEPGDDA